MRNLDDIDPEDELTPEEWAEEYENILKNPPSEGDYLWTQDYKAGPDDNDPDAGRIRLEIELMSGKPPFIFARAYIPNIVGRRPNWYVYGMNDIVNHGWKVVLHPSSRDRAILKFGVKTKFIHCRKLLVLRQSLSGNCIVAEIDEW
jgi:hypothetical protein